jgi:hypothetical protein
MDALAEFYRLQGHKVLRTESCWWFNAFGPVYQALPQHQAVEPSQGELRRLLRRALGLKYTATTGPANSYLWLCSGAYDLERLAPKARNQTRKALRHCLVARVDFDYLRLYGYRAVRDTCLRQGRRPPGQEHWAALCSAAQKAGIFQGWGAFLGSSLAAFLIAYEAGGLLYILYHYSATEALPYCPNNALIYRVLERHLLRPDIQAVSYGLQALDVAAQGLEHFKGNMGFKKVPISQRVLLSPVLRPLAGRLLQRPLRSLGRKAELLRRLSGFLHLYETQKQADGTP